MGRYHTTEKQIQEMLDELEAAKNSNGKKQWTRKRILHVISQSIFTIVFCSMLFLIFDNASGNLQDHLKGFGIYLDGTKKGNSILTDRLYFTNNELRLTSFELIPKIENDKMFYNQSSLEDHAKVTTQGEMGLEWNDAKNGFYLICAVKLDPLGNDKQVRVFTADKNMNKMKEVNQYYDTPWTGKPPLRPVYKNSSTIYAGYHANNSDGRSVNFSEFKVSNGLSSIPADLLNKYGW